MKSVYIQIHIFTYYLGLSLSEIIITWDHYYLSLSNVAGCAPHIRLAKLRPGWRRGGEAGGTGSHIFPCQISPKNCHIFPCQIFLKSSHIFPCQISPKIVIFFLVKYRQKVVTFFLVTYRQKVVIFFLVKYCQILPFWLSLYM